VQKWRRPLSTRKKQRKTPEKQANGPANKAPQGVSTVGPLPSASPRRKQPATRQGPSKRQPSPLGPTSASNQESMGQEDNKKGAAGPPPGPKARRDAKGWQGRPAPQQPWGVGRRGNGGWGERGAQRSPVVGWSGPIGSALPVFGPVRAMSPLVCSLRFRRRLAEGGGQGQ
jgi:hypothetical protein